MQEYFAIIVLFIPFFFFGFWSLLARWARRKKTGEKTGKKITQLK
jgi:hypothetical protein